MLCPARYRLAILAAATCMLPLSLLPGRAVAGEAAVAEFQRAAYSADYSAGIAKLQAMSSSDPADVEAVFGRGALQFFGAFATFQQNLYRHSGAPQLQGAGGGMSMVGALLPLPGLFGVSLMPYNPKATPMTYRALRGYMERFVSDLQAAEATLALVKDRPVKLLMRPSQIALDLDGNGKIDPGERLFAFMFGMMRTDPTFAFDTADASWLRGYSHVMMATTNLLLAVDFERTYEAVAHNAYGLSATAFGREMQRQVMSRRPSAELAGLQQEAASRVAALQREQTLANAEQSELRNRINALPKGPEAREERQALEAQLRLAFERTRRLSAEQQQAFSERRQLEGELAGLPPGNDMAGVMDLVAAVHTMSWNVVEPARLRAVRTHLLQVMALNRNTWRLVRAETDDDREWLPSARQTSVFGVKLTDEVIDSWLATTALAEDVLEGRKLLPHPRFRDRGVNLKKLLETAKRLDVVMLATGHDLLPYLEQGEIVEAAAWRAITRPMDNNLAMFAVWFN